MAMQSSSAKASQQMIKGRQSQEYLHEGAQAVSKTDVPSATF